MENKRLNLKSILERSKWSLLFWSCQVFYFGTVTAIWYQNTPDIDDFTYGKWHQIMAFVYFLTALFLIGSIRFFIKKYVSIARFDTRNFLKILLLISTVTLIWHPTHQGVRMLVNYSIGSSNVTYPEMLIQKSNYGILLADYITVFSWIITYLGAKTIINRNADRIKKSELLASIKRAELDSLQLHVDPHFLFNNLNNIRGLMLENPSKSKEVLHKLAAILHYNLHTPSEREISSIKDELKMVDCLIDLCKLQLEDRFLFSKNIGNIRQDMEIPSMLVQILVENAIKHGVSNVKDGGSVKILVHQLHSELHIKVINTASSIHKKLIKGSRLLNLEKRLQLIYGGHANFSMQWRNDEVVTSVSIPVEKSLY